MKQITIGKQLKSLRTIEKSIVQYVDEMFKGYGYSLDKDEIANKAKDKNNAYFTDLAKDMSDIYFISYAKELLAEAKITESVTEADNNDTNADDDKIGYFAKSDFISKFKSKHERDYNVNVILMRFTDSDEFNETLRAFGLKITNSKIYFVGDSEETKNMTYNEYCDYYNDLTTTQTRTKLNVSESFSPAILGIYIEMYNYIYGGYRKTLSTALEASADPTVIDSVKVDVVRVVAAGIVYRREEAEPFYRLAVNGRFQRVFAVQNVFVDLCNSSVFVELGFISKRGNVESHRQSIRGVELDFSDNVSRLDCYIRCEFFRGAGKINRELFALAEFNLVDFVPFRGVNGKLRFVRAAKRAANNRLANRSGRNDVQAHARFLEVLLVFAAVFFQIHVSRLVLPNSAKNGDGHNVMTKFPRVNVVSNNAEFNVLLSSVIDGGFEVAANLADGRAVLFRQLTNDGFHFIQLQIFEAVRRFR